MCNTGIVPNVRRGASSLGVGCGLLHNSTGHFPAFKLCGQRTCCWLFISLEKGPETCPQSTQYWDRVSWLAEEAGFLFLTVSCDWVALSAWNFASLFPWPFPLLRSVRSSSVLGHHQCSRGDLALQLLVACGDIAVRAEARAWGRTSSQAVS